MTDFFKPETAYRHSSENGSEGIFLVKYVGRAPGPFEHHSETLGVAFGWLWGPGPNGWEGRGAYLTPDFVGWEEIPLPPCGAQVSGHTCVSTEPDHYRHHAANGNYWFNVDPCKHDDCQNLDCDPVPSVHCGAPNDAGDHCLLLTHAGRTPHVYLES
ncbi:hypothetical protein [Kitasatospora sp. NBC_01302]|uniref:hypothetical protein n=1 Tax=Kitasatospora sp. NBC_01302 TaxID=2903575 RepID=UPI002E1208AD|nr:hypothetical protein OG294_14020 [Kitasatospora sp. NBC_01302]